MEKTLQWLSREPGGRAYVLSVDQHLTTRMCEELRASVRREIGTSAPVIVLGAGMTLTIIQDEPQPRFHPLYDAWLPIGDDAPAETMRRPAPSTPFRKC